MKMSTGWERRWGHERAFRIKLQAGWYKWVSWAHLIVFKPSLLLFFHRGFSFSVKCFSFQSHYTQHTSRSRGVVWSWMNSESESLSFLSNFLVFSCSMLSVIKSVHNWRLDCCYDGSSMIERRVRLLLRMKGWWAGTRPGWNVVSSLNCPFLNSEVAESCLGSVISFLWSPIPRDKFSPLKCSW